MKGHIMILLCFAMCAACRGRYYTVVKDFSTEGKGVVEIDRSYRLYMRKMYKNETGKNLYTFSPAAPYPDSLGRLVEVEYLFVSPEKKNVVYVTTVPDKFQKYYNRYQQPEGQVNAHDFNTFHFGSLDQGVRLKGRKGKELRWEIKMGDDQFSIDKITEFKNGRIVKEVTISDALNAALTFYRQPDYEIYLYNPRAHKTQEQKVKSLDRRLYFSPRKCESRASCSYVLYLTFEHSLPKAFTAPKPDQGKTPEPNSTIRFGRERSNYSPEVLTVD